MADPLPKRCFVALPIDEAPRQDLADLAAEATVPGMRRTPIANLHATVKFLGDVADSQMPPLLEALDAAREGVGPFDLALKRLTYLPNASRPRVLAAKLDRPSPLVQLQQQVEALSEAVGFAKEQRAYNPHVTLGRYRRGARETLDLEPISREHAGRIGWAVREFVLFQSILEPTGVRHVELERFALE